MSDIPEVNGEQTLEDGPGGLGGKYERVESGLTKNIDQNMTLRAAGWQRGRWDTCVTLEELRERIAARGGRATLKEKIALKAFEALGSEDSRAANRAMRAGIQMERQNQVDELAALNSGQDPQLHGAPPVAPDAIASAMDDTIPAAAAG